METWHDIGADDRFADDTATRALAGGQAVAVFRLDGELYALRDLCTHGHALLSDGYVEDGCVECPLHQGTFDIRTGAPRCAPVTEAVRTFPVRVVAGRVHVGVVDKARAAEAPPQRLVAKLLGIERPAPDVAVLRLAADADFRYRPGQYLDVLMDDGQRRSYSMAAMPAADGALEFHVRHLPGGIFTERVFGNAGPGDTLQLEGPSGSFYLRDGEAPAILLASGTGFAPIKAIVESLIASGTLRRLRLYWGGRRLADLYHHALCLAWAAQHPWLEYVPVLSDAGTEAAWSGRAGFVHEAVLQDHPDLSRHEVYACGAPAMVEAARRDFVGTRGLPADRFFADAFLSKADTVRRPAASPSSSVDSLGSP